MHTQGQGRYLSFDLSIYYISRYDLTQRHHPAVAVAVAVPTVATATATAATTTAATTTAGSFLFAKGEPHPCILETHGRIVRRVATTATAAAPGPTPPTGGVCVGKLEGQALILA